MTGIGNYCFRLLQTLVASNDDLIVWGFTGLSWRKLEADLFQRLEIAHQKQFSEYDSSSWTSNSTASAKLAIREKLQNTEVARRLYRTVRARCFNRRLPKTPFFLFHAFRYLPPAALPVPILPVVYDLSFERYPGFHPLDRRRQLAGLAKAISNAPLVQTISEFSKAEIVELYGCPIDKIIVAPPAPAEIFEPLGAQITCAGLSSLDLHYKQYFLAVGTLEPRKNLRTLIAAYSNLSAAHRAHFPLIIVGNAGWGDLALPPESARLIQRGELRFLNRIKDVQLRHLYEGANALLFPSIYEGFGMPIIEALACGTRVAHSKDSSMDEITNGLAIRAPALDCAAWTEIMRSFADDPEGSWSKAEERIARARQYTWRNSAEIVREAYVRIMTG